MKVTHTVCDNCRERFAGPVPFVFEGRDFCHAVCAEKFYVQLISRSMDRLSHYVAEDQTRKSADA